MSPSRPLVIWCNYRLRPASVSRLRGAIRPHRPVLDRNQTHTDMAPAVSARKLARANIGIGQVTIEDLLAHPNVRSFHIASASYTRYDRTELTQHFSRSGRTLTNTSQVFAEPCAQHVLAMMLAFARQLPQSAQTQVIDRAWHYDERREGSKLLNHQNVVILGFGAMAKRPVQLLAPFEVHIGALRRCSIKTRGVTALTSRSLPLALGRADHVINILPDKPATRGFASRSLLRRVKKGAIFYNIGRGATVDQPALLRALQSRRLGGAYLDVVSPEPLPPTHPLWKARNCFITPHTGGEHLDEQERLVTHFISLFREYHRTGYIKSRIV